MSAEATSANTGAAPSAFCNLCRESRPAAFLYRVASCDIVRCAQCGLVFVSPDSVPGSTADIYSEEYFEGGLADGYTDYEASEALLRQQAGRMLRVIQRHQPAGKRLLEIGCAYGFFLLESQTVYDSEGLEISEFAARKARQRGLKVTCGDFLTAPIGDSQFDVVCLFDCIEHLTDPFRYLEKAQRVLNRGGTVVLTTGDIGSLYARFAGARWRLMTPPQHLFYFSRRTLSCLLEKAGFEVLDVSYPWKLVPLRLIIYQLSPRLKNVLGPLGNMPGGIYVNLFDAMRVIGRKK